MHVTMPSVQMPAGQQLWRHGAKRALQAAETQSLHALVIRVPVVPHAREEEHRLARTLLCRQSYFPRSHSRRGLGLQHSRHQSWIQAGNVGLRGGALWVAFRSSYCIPHVAVHSRTVKPILQAAPSRLGRSLVCGRFRRTRQLLCCIFTCLLQDFSEPVVTEACKNIPGTVALAGAIAAYAGTDMDTGDTIARGRRRFCLLAANKTLVRNLSLLRARTD